MKTDNTSEYNKHVMISAFDWANLLTEYIVSKDKSCYKNFDDWLDKVGLKESRMGFHTKLSDNIKNGKTDCIFNNASLQEFDESK